MKKDIVASNVKCPKCSNTRELRLTEVWKGHTISWEVECGVFDMNDGALEPGDAYKVEAKCNSCGHIWTIRGARQIGGITNSIAPTKAKNSKK